MISGESMGSDVTYEVPEVTKSVGLLQRTSLGENNLGQFGPMGETPEETEQEAAYMIQEVSRPECSRDATNCWRCPDGRLLAGQNDPECDIHYSAPQTGGGIGMTDTSVELMINKTPEPVAKLLATKTRRAVIDGQDVVAHGSVKNGRGDCAANVKQRKILKYNGDNLELVVPIAWELGLSVGLSKYLTPADVTELITTGRGNADNDVLWQELADDGTMCELSAEHKTDIQTENGARYEALVDDHHERVVRIDISDKAFDEAQIVRNNIDKHGDAMMAFNVSLGKLQKTIFQRVQKHGGSERDAAQQTMAAILWNVGLTKLICNKNMPVAVVGYLS